MVDLILSLLPVQVSSRWTILTIEKPSAVEGNIAPCFSLKFRSIFVHISDAIDPVTLIWVSMEDIFLLQNLSISNATFWSKEMMSEAEQRPRLVMAGSGWHSRILGSGMLTPPNSSGNIQ